MTVISNKNKYGTFGEQVVAQKTPRILLQFPYNLNARLVTVANTGEGAASQADSMAKVDTTAASSSSSKLTSVFVSNYSPGTSVVVEFTAIFTEGASGSTQWIGIGTDEDGYFIGINGTDFAINRRKGGVDNIVASGSWNKDAADGTGGLPAIDTEKMNVFEIEYVWLGGGPIHFRILHPTESRFVEVHSDNYPNTETSPSTDNPSFPLYMKATNTSNATSIAIRTSSMAAFRVGLEDNQGPLHGAIGNKTSIADVFLPLLTIRNKTQVFGGSAGNNRAILRILKIAGAFDGNKNGEMELLLNAELTGASFADLDTDTSIVEVDTSATAIVSGTCIFTIPVNKQGTISEDLFDIDGVLPPGGSITLAARGVSGSAHEASMSILWQEKL